MTPFCSGLEDTRLLIPGAAVGDHRYQAFRIPVCIPS